MKKRDLSTCIQLIQDNGDIITYSSIEEAAENTGLTERQLKSRATKETIVKGTKFKWCDPSTKRSYIGRRSRKKGNNWELEIIHKLKDIGYDGCVSSRSESKKTDDAKIDIIDLNKVLPCYIQAKATKNIPNYYKIEQECPMKDLPFVIACKQNGKKPIAILPMDFLYELLKPRV